MADDLMEIDEGSPKTMDDLPNEVVQYMLSFIKNAKDVAMCNGVCKTWRESAIHRKMLFFPRSLCEGKYRQSDAVVGRMVLKTQALEELIIFCPFHQNNLRKWLIHTNASLKHLELRLDNVKETHSGIASNTSSVVDCIGQAHLLERLRLWGLHLLHAPAWEAFGYMHTLEVVGIRARDFALNSMIRACPNLKVLALIGCDGVRAIDIDLQFLEECRLDFYGPGDCNVRVASPALQSLEVQGAAWIALKGTHSLKRLCISNNAGKVMRVECGRLLGLETLVIRGVQWVWEAVYGILQSVPEVKHLLMKIEFTGDGDHLQPFPEIDFVDFFNKHPKLTTFEVHGAMFAALSQRNSLAKVDSNFTIPSLEGILITVRSPLNAEQKMHTLETIVKYSSRLRKLVLRVFQMKNCEESADKFFEKVMRFKHMNRIVKIE